MMLGIKCCVCFGNERGRNRPKCFCTFSYIIYIAKPAPEKMLPLAKIESGTACSGGACLF